jgi:hypothetical protein
MAPEANSPRSDVNVSGDYFSLAGYEVTTYGRIWVTPEVSERSAANALSSPMYFSRKGVVFDSMRTREIGTS